MTLLEGFNVNSRITATSASTMATIKFPPRNVFGRLPINPLRLATKLKTHRWSNRERRHYPETSELFAFLDGLGRKAVPPVTSKEATARGIQPFHAHHKKRR